MEWFSLDEQVGATTPRLLCEKISLSDYRRPSDLEFVKNVLKQNRISDKQLLVLYKIEYTLIHRQRRSNNNSMDMDEWYDLGYNGHPGQYDGGGFYC